MLTDAIERTVFEISAAPGSWTLVSLVAVAAGIGALVYGWAKYGRRLDSMQSVFPYLWGLMAILMGGLAAGVTLFERGLAYSAYRRGATEQIAGTVHVLAAEPPTGRPHGDEIEIAGRRLDVGRVEGPGYARTIREGGVLREGTEVRI